MPLATPCDNPAGLLTHPRHGLPSALDHNGIPLLTDKDGNNQKDRPQRFGDKDMQKSEPLLIEGGNRKMVQLLWKAVWKFLKKLNIKLTHDPVIPLLSIYPKEMKT